ncbi:MAG: TetR/AcrR family transcriptional regulator [Tissierellia bacterium]|nr:TetR/AcrR family transcriptional regulator [Tissierellia bacterium]
MARKTVFTREEILKTAFNIFKIEGLDNITARKLASKMGSSTAPIYTNFQNIEEIKELVLDYAFNILEAYTKKDYTENKFLNIGVGLLCFARDYTRIYKTLFMENSNYKSLFDTLEGRNINMMKLEKTLEYFDEKELLQILNKMHIFTHGLSAFLCAGILEDKSDEYFIKILEEMGHDVMLATLLKKGKLSESIVNDCGEENNK